MSIPDYQALMLPVLKFAGDRKEHSLREMTDKLARELRLTESERKVLLPSGRETTFSNRVGWARTYLKKAGLLKLTRWGYVCITERGLDLLMQNPKEINVTTLLRFPEFKQFKAHVDMGGTPGARATVTTKETPEEALEVSYQRVRNNLANELLTQIKAVSPTMFEQVVLDLLVKMGYGGTYREARQAVGGTGDEGIDGTINEDKLGLDRIYIQAKRWQNSVVGRPEVQKFAGALQGKHARKGIFITTSDFTKEAREYANQIENRIILLDGNQIVQLMLDHKVGVNVASTYEVAKIDTDYFAED